MANSQRKGSIFDSFYFPVFQINESIPVICQRFPISLFFKEHYVPIDFNVLVFDEFHFLIISGYYP